jgi:hypothetical protein
VDNWNQLPESVRAEEKLPPFRRKLKGLVAEICSRQNEEKKQNSKRDAQD